MKILKFGGSSIGTPERIGQVMEIVLKSLEKKVEIACVFSAFEGITDQLIDMSRTAAAHDEAYKERFKMIEKRHQEVVTALIGITHQSSVHANIKLLFNELEDILHGVYLIRELTAKTSDFILSFGERLSAYIISECLKQKITEVEFLDARKVMVTDDTFSSANVLFDVTFRHIEEYFKNHRALQVITGFIGVTPNGETTTLGRGGSDYTASIFGAALHVSEIEIWTDVGGVMTADPRKVTRAFPIESMSYVEAMEMSHFGARVIYPPTLQPVLERKIPIRIKNVFDPDFPGTVICNEPMLSNEYPIRGISSIENIALLRMQGSGMIGVVGISGRLFSVLAREKINVILISQASSEHSICFAINKSESTRAMKSLKKEFELEIGVHHIDEISVEDNLTIIAVVGENMRRTPGIAGKVFQAVGDQRISVVAIAQGSSELNISFVVEKKDEANALNAVHDAFFNRGI